MSITLFGSCRLDNIKNHNNLNKLINFTHTTKEVIQLIKFLKKEIIFPSPYNIFCFRTGIVNNIPIEYSNNYNNLFIKSKICIIEICSNRKYIHNNYYLHHLSVDVRYPKYNKKTPKSIINNFIIEKQDKAEIEKDIIEIQKILYPKKIIIVSHYNAKKNGKYLENRIQLINILNDICNENKIHFINPANIFNNIEQNKIINEDLGHYTNYGHQIFSDYVNKYIENNFSIN